jgi:hypothetical protein
MIRRRVVVTPAFVATTRWRASQVSPSPGIDYN